MSQPGEGLHVTFWFWEEPSSWQMEKHTSRSHDFTLWSGSSDGSSLDAPDCKKKKNPKENLSVFAVDHWFRQMTAWANANDRQNIACCPLIRHPVGLYCCACSLIEMTALIWNKEKLLNFASAPLGSPRLNNRGPYLWWLYWWWGSTNHDPDQ